MSLFRLLLLSFLFSTLSINSEEKKKKKKTHRALDLDRREAPAGLEDGLELGLGGAGAVDGAVGVGGRRGEGLRLLLLFFFFWGGGGGGSEKEKEERTRGGSTSV